METKSKNNISSVTLVQTVLQAILSVSAVIYFVGFLIVNSYYSIFGITHYQLVQTRYVSAGLSFVLINICFSGLIAAILLVLEQTRPIIWIISFFIVWAMLGISIYVFSNAIIDVILISINAGIVILLAYQINLIWLGMPNKWFEIFLDSDNSQIQMRTAFIGIGFAILLCLGSLSWGLSFWPHMSSTLGGGRLSEAVFILDENNLPEDGLPLIPMQSKTISEQIPILFEDSDGYVVIVQTTAIDKIAVRLSKSIVKSIVYAPAEIAGKKQKLPSFAQ